MAEHWALNKRLDPNSTNRHVEAVLCRRGALRGGPASRWWVRGGGGFAEIVAHDGGRRLVYRRGVASRRRPRRTPGGLAEGDSGGERVKGRGRTRAGSVPDAEIRRV